MVAIQPDTYFAMKEAEWKQRNGDPEECRNYVDSSHLADRQMDKAVCARCGKTFRRRIGRWNQSVCPACYKAKSNLRRTCASCGEVEIRCCSPGRMDIPHYCSKPECQKAKRHDIYVRSKNARVQER